MIRWKHKESKPKWTYIQHHSSIRPFKSHDLSISLPFNISSPDEPASEPAEHPHRAFKSSHLALDLVVATWWLNGEVIYEQVHPRVPESMTMVYVQGETAPSA